jgi:uridine kinase
MANVVIGISGGSASGKTTFANLLKKEIDADIVLLRHDNYYKPNDHLSFEERKKLNFDHPEAFDTHLLIDDIKKLKAGISINQPVYSYAQHTRLAETKLINPAKIIVVEGILVFESNELVDLMDIKVYIDTDADLRLIRRIVRDVKERGRDFDSVIEQYLRFAKPMHDEFVEPNKRKADIIIPYGKRNEVALSMVVDKIKAILNS